MSFFLYVFLTFSFLLNIRLRFTLEYLIYIYIYIYIYFTLNQITNTSTYKLLLLNYLLLYSNFLIFEEIKIFTNM